MIWWMSIVTAAVLGTPAPETSPLDIADRVKRLTVRIAVHEGDDEREGFGVVLGERDGWLYIGTANHVVRGSAGPNGEAEAQRRAVKLTYYTDQGVSYDGSVLENFVADFDLGVVKAKSPPGFRTDVLCNDALNVVRGLRVAYVGKERAWYVPTSEGRVNQEPDAKEWLNVDSMTVEPGTSGAPVFSGYGLVGLVVNSAKLQTFVAAAGRVERAFRTWNYPFGGAACMSRQTAAEKPRVSFRDLPAHEAVPEAPAQGPDLQALVTGIARSVDSTAAPARPASGGPGITPSVEPAGVSAPPPASGGSGPPPTMNRVLAPVAQAPAATSPKAFGGPMTVQILMRSRASRSAAFKVTPASPIQTRLIVAVRGGRTVADVAGPGLSCPAVPLDVRSGVMVMQAGAACRYADSGGVYTLRIREGTFSPRARGMALQMETDVTDVDGPPEKKARARQLETRLKFAFEGIAG